MNRRLVPLTVLLVLLGCQGDAPSRPVTPPDLAKGFGLSPQGFPGDYSRLPDFYAEVGGMENGAVMWNGAWRDDAGNGSDAGKTPAGALSVMQGAKTYGFTPITVFGWRSGSQLLLRVPGDTTNDWSNTEARRRFKSMLASFAASRKPPYVFLGNENDFYYERNPTDYARWIAFYNEAYDTLKQVSPSTRVGPVFSYEHLAGRGGLNGWTTARWGALEAHDLSRVDLVGISLYPWLGYVRPGQIPGDYLAPLVQRLGGKPIAITETGWPAENLGGLNPPWGISEADQVAYLDRLRPVLAGIAVRIVDWTFLYPWTDPGDHSLEWKLFGSVSLRDDQGAKRPAYATWAGFGLDPANGTASIH